MSAWRLFLQVRVDYDALDLFKPKAQRDIAMSATFAKPQLRLLFLPVDHDEAKFRGDRSVVCDLGPEVASRILLMDRFDGSGELDYGSDDEGSSRREILVDHGPNWSFNGHLQDPELADAIRSDIIANHGKQLDPEQRKFALDCLETEQSITRFGGSQSLPEGVGLYWDGESFPPDENTLTKDEDKDWPSLADCLRGFFQAKARD